jgi:hypothetical protein
MNQHQFDLTAKPPQVNELLQQWKSAGGDMNQVSDGYHTFGELYEHRCLLFILAAKLDVFGSINMEHHYEHSEDCRWYRSSMHHDGSSYDGWFIMGFDHSISADGGVGMAEKQISYHLPIKLWGLTDFCKTMERAPEWDGHTSKDVCDRLTLLIQKIPIELDED